jgi:hypothetical protein
MSSPDHAIVPSAFKGGLPCSFTAADGTKAKLVADVTAPQAGSSTLPRLIGGSTIIDATVTSTDAAAKEITVWYGTVYTTAGGATGTLSTTISSIVRASGSFITDGWLVGDLAMMFAPTIKGAAIAPGANDGILGIITAVSATTLSVHGTPFTATTVAATTRICRMAHGFRAAIPAQSGSLASVPNVSLLNNGSDASLLKFEKKLGADDVVALSMGAAVSALPAYISVEAVVALY